MFLSTQVALAVAIRMLGGDVDINGCIKSAGYVWCAITEQCIPVNELCIL